MSTSYLSRLSRSVLNTLKQARDPFEGAGLRGATLFDFAEECSVGNWRVGSDYPFGGYSKGDVRWIGPESGSDMSELGPRGRQEEGRAEGDRQEEGRAEGDRQEATVGLATVQEAFMRFSGVYSKRIDPSRAHPKMKRAGFVSMTGRPLDSLDAHIDLESFNALRYTIRVHKNSVHRTFLANLRSDNWVTGGQNEDVWQVVLHDGQKDGDWDGWKEVEVRMLESAMGG